MGVIRINDELQKKIEVWIKKNGNKYKHPSLTAFVNNSVYEQLKKLEKGVVNEKIQ